MAGIQDAFNCPRNIWTVENFVEAFDDASISEGSMTLLNVLGMMNQAELSETDTDTSKFSQT